MSAQAGPRLHLRWWRFNAVGALGFAVQTLSLSALVSGFHVHFALATVLAVECAVLHNFIWHHRCTWRDRADISRGGWIRQLLLFNASTGAISILGNLLLMTLLTGVLGLHYLAANIISVVTLSLANFGVSHGLVFPARVIREAVRQSRSG